MLAAFLSIYPVQCLLHEFISRNLNIILHNINQLLFTYVEISENVEEIHYIDKSLWTPEHNAHMCLLNMQG